MVSFSRMSDQWSGGIQTATADVVWDVSEAAPDVFDGGHEGVAGGPVGGRGAPRRRARSWPRRRRASKATSIASAATTGRSASRCSRDKANSDVVVIKGSEPLLPDFERYLDWMRFKGFGAWPRPMMEHFPLFEGKTPGTVSLDEARKEAELALDVQAAHLRHYGELVRLPVPLLVLAVPERHMSA